MMYHIAEKFDGELNLAVWHRSASKVNRLVADAQIVSCHGYLDFHPFVEQLTVFCISGLVLALSFIL